MATMDEIARALNIGPRPPTSSRTIDITTTGARSGLARRIEIWFWQVDGRWYLASDPGQRSWFANLVAHPEFTVHLKRGVRADLPATAQVVADPETRRRVLQAVIDQSGRHESVTPWVQASPLVEIRFRDDLGSRASSS